MKDLLCHIALSLAMLSALSATAQVPAPAESAARPDKWLRSPVPAGWDSDTIPVLAAPSSDSFWKYFNDPLLQRLLTMADENNLNLSASLARIESASQALRKIQSGYYSSIGLSAEWTKERQSGLQMSRSGRPSDIDYFSLGLSANWEIDVFGRIRSQAKEGRASLDASRADRAAVALSVGASIVRNYFTLRSYQEQLEVALDHIDSQEKILAMTQARYEAGLASALDVAQARSVVLSTKASIPRLNALIDSEINAIALLCGVYRDGLPAELFVHSPLPDAQMAVPASVPADLLRRRPDIVESEYRLRALAASLGVAKKEFLPRLSISGTVGTSAHNISDLFKSDSFTWSVAPQLSWTVFDGLGRQADVAMAKADLMASVDAYNQSVMQAVFEVNNYISSYSADIESIGLESQVVAEYEKTLRLAVDRYKLGLSDFSNVANAQIDLLACRNSLITSKAAALSDLVALYQALGGGWTVTDMPN